METSVQQAYCKYFSSSVSNLLDNGFPPIATSSTSRKVSISQMSLQSVCIHELTYLRACRFSFTYTDQESRNSNNLIRFEISRPDFGWHKSVLTWSTVILLHLRIWLIISNLGPGIWLTLWQGTKEAVCVGLALPVSTAWHSSCLSSVMCAVPHLKLPR